MKVKVYRNCDTIRIRKVVIEIWDGDQMLDRRRMFMFGRFEKRLARKIKRMKALCEKMLAASV